MSSVPPEKFTDYIRQQRELYPEDFYIPKPRSGQPVPVQAGASEAGTAEDRAVPRYAPPASGDLEAYHRQICDCLRCPLGETRTRFVFGVGDPDADLMFVGEAPGYQEDQQGEPFVGQAGQLLDKILAAIDLTRGQVYIANVLKCRPPKNRDPRPEEIEACEPYLQAQIGMVQPKALIALGRVAGNTLLKTSRSLRELRGRTWNYQDRDLIVTYHPAALLRNQELKRPTWEDFQKIQARYLS